MDEPQVVSRDEWLAARRELLAQEKEFTRHRDALNTCRRAGHRHGQQHLPVARPDRPRPAGRLVREHRTGYSATPGSADLRLTP
jgi:Bacterial protein of unknown function (DUF899)